MVKKILIVDDDQEMLLALQSGFGKYQDSFSVQIAKDGVEAVERLKQEAISLVVTDLKMPRMDGFALLQHIMQHYPDIPVIVITGYSTPKMEKMARRGGAVGYIAKPFMLDNLARQIMATLRKESEGGTLHSVSSGIFLQLMEMEQKTCTIRLENLSNLKKGVLFFRNGELLDARVNNLQGTNAAYEIFAWDTVTISIQNVCPKMENKIQSELQPLILEATRRKDESDADEEPESQPESVTEQQQSYVSPTERIKEIKILLAEKVGPRCGLEDIYQDHSWSDFVDVVAVFGKSVGFGDLKIGYVDRGDANDFVLIPEQPPIILFVSPKCPRDKIVSALNR